jgi:hypothetical protein
MSEWQREGKRSITLNSKAFLYLAASPSLSATALFIQQRGDNLVKGRERERERENKTTELRGECSKKKVP